MLVAFLDYFRETMIAKNDGLDEQQARWKPAPTANSLIGLISHLALVEHWWFQQCFHGDPEFPRPEWADPEDHDWDFKPPESVTIAEAVAAYRTHWERSNEITRAAGSLDEVAAHPRGAQRGITLRWILVHMVEETARHAGHADITRELIDGVVGD